MRRCVVWTTRYRGMVWTNANVQIYEAANIVHGPVEIGLYLL